MSHSHKFFLLVASALAFVSVDCKSPNQPEKPADDSFLTLLYPRVGVKEIAVSPNGIIYALVEDGVLRSSDNGNSWQLSISDYPNGSIAFGPDGDVYIPARTGIYRSTTGGNSWYFTDSCAKIRLNGSLYSEYLTSVVVTSNNFVFATSMDQIQRSTDRGVSWMVTDTSLKSGSFVSLISTSKDELFTVGFDAVLKSTNLGLSWDRLSEQSRFWTFLFKDSSENLFLSTIFSNTCRSTDNGVNWTPVYTGFFEGFACGRRGFLVAVSNDLYTSSDDGASWNIAATRSTLGPLITCLAFGKDGFLYVGTSLDGIYKTTKSLTQ